MEQRAQEAGALGLNNFEKFVTVVCWWSPCVALLSLFFGSAPRQLKRHAKWSFITAVAVFVGAVVLGVLFAGLGALVAGEQGASVGALVAGIFGFLAALVNTIAVISNRGLYFSLGGGTGARFI
ncbi:hypothetical protein BH24ACT22_BH24ACT22_11910 [soil metagenome]